MEEFPYGGYIVSYDNGEFPQLEAYNGDQRSKNVCWIQTISITAIIFVQTWMRRIRFFKKILKLEEADDGTNSYVRVIRYS